MADKMARKKADKAGTGASTIKTATTAEVVPAPETTCPAAPAALEATRSDEAGPCTQSHVPNARTRKTLRDADAGKNLIHYPSLEAMFEDLGI